MPEFSITMIIQTVYPEDKLKSIIIKDSLGKDIQAKYACIM